MKLPVPRACLLIAFLLLLPSGSARAHTGEDREFTCPLCGETFEDYVATSGTSFGQRLDFKDVGPTFSPWPVPRCTHCGFVLYTEELDEARAKCLRAFVHSEAYAPIWKKHTDFYCLGLLRETCEDPTPMSLATTFLEATWELDDGDQRYAAYAAKAIQCLARVPPPREGGTAEEAEEEEEARMDHLVAHYLQVELHRRCGEFEAAKQVLTGIEKLDLTDAPEWYDRAVAFQASLVAEQDRAPHEFRELPPPREEPEEESGAQDASDR